MSQLVSSTIVTHSVSSNVDFQQAIFTSAPQFISSASAVHSFSPFANVEIIASLAVTCTSVSASLFKNPPAGITQSTNAVVGRPTPLVLNSIPVMSHSGSEPFYSVTDTRLIPAMAYWPIPHATVIQTNDSSSSLRTSPLPTQLLPPPLTNQCSAGNNAKVLSLALVKTPKSCVRPFKLTCLVRTRFEEAALRYASVLRTAAVFSSAQASTTTATLTITTPVTASTSAIFSAAAPDKLCRSRPWEQDDSIMLGIQEMRCQFAPVTSASNHPHPLLRQTLYSTTAAPSLMHSLAPVSILKSPVSRALSVLPRRKGPSVVSNGNRQGHPLFRGARGHGQDQRKTHQEGKELEDLEDWIDVEEVSPPQTTYHMYHMTADGISDTLPITVTPMKPNLKQSEVMNASPLCQYTCVSSPECHHSLSVCNTAHYYSLANFPLHEDEPNGLQLRSYPYISLPECRDYVLQFVPQTGMVHSKSTPLPCTSHHHTGHGSASIGTSVLQRPLSCQQAKLTLHKGTYGQDHATAQKKIFFNSEQDTVDEDLHVISVSKSDKIPDFIILSSDSSPETIEKGNDFQTYFGKKQSCEYSSPMDPLSSSSLGTTSNLSKLVPLQDVSTRDTSETLLVSEECGNLLDLFSSSLCPRTEYFEHQALSNKDLKVAGPDITQNGIQGGKNIIGDIKLSDTSSFVEEKSELVMMIPENLKDSKMVSKVDDDLLDMNYSPSLKCPHKELYEPQQMNDQNVQAFEPRVTCDIVHGCENITDDIDLSGASTVIFDNSELDLTLTDIAKDSKITTDTDFNQVFNIIKTFSSSNVTGAKEGLSADDVHESFNCKNEALNFKLLHTSSDDSLDPQSPEVDHLAYKQNHGKNLVCEGNKLQIIACNSVKLNSIPGVLQCSENGRLFRETSCIIKDKKDQNNSIAENEFYDRTHDTIWVKQMKQEDLSCDLLCKNLVNVTEDRRSKHVNLREGSTSDSNGKAEIHETESLSKDSEMDIGLEKRGLSKNKLAHMALEEENLVISSYDNNCEFADVSSTVFVSDGKIFPIHLLDSHQQGCIQVTSSDELGLIHQHSTFKYDKDCQANITRKRDHMVQGDLSLCDKSETLIKKKPGMIKTRETLTKIRKKMMEVVKTLTQTNRSTEVKDATVLKKDEMSNGRCEDFEGNNEGIRMDRILMENDRALIEKHGILVEKNKILSKAILPLVQKSGSLLEQSVTSIMFVDIEKNIYDSHNEQNRNTVRVLTVDKGSLQQLCETSSDDHIKEVELPPKFSDLKTLKGDMMKKEIPYSIPSSSVPENSYITNWERDHKISRKHGNMHSESLRQQRYLSTIQDLMEEIKIMGEREVKFKLQERVSVTKDSNTNKTGRNKKSVLDERKEMKECTIKLQIDINCKGDDMKSFSMDLCDKDKDFNMQVCKRGEKSEPDTKFQSVSLGIEEIATIDKLAPMINGPKILDLGQCFNLEKEDKINENKEVPLSSELTQKNKTEYEVDFIKDQQVYPEVAAGHIREVAGRVEYKASLSDRDQCDRSPMEYVKITESQNSSVNSGYERVHRVNDLGDDFFCHVVNQTKMDNVLNKFDPQKNDKIDNINVARLSTDCTNQASVVKNTSFKTHHVIEVEDDVSVIQCNELDQAEGICREDGIITENKTSSNHELQGFDEDSEMATGNCDEAMSIRKVSKLTIHKEITRNNTADVLSKFQTQTLTPEVNIKVMPDLKDVKQDSTIFPYLSLGGVSMCDFVKRISEKINQLIIKPKSTVLETEHHKYSEKHFHFSESTPEDFIARHHWAKEEKGMECSKSQSPASHYHGSVNKMCDTKGPLDTSNNAFCTVHVSEGFTRSSIPHMLQPPTQDVLLSASGPQLSFGNVCSFTSDTHLDISNAQASTSDMQVSVSCTKACASDSQKFYDSAEVFDSGAQQPSSGVQAPASDIQSSSSSARVLSINMQTYTSSGHQSASGSKASHISKQINAKHISSTLDVQQLSAVCNTRSTHKCSDGAQPSVSGGKPHVNRPESFNSGEWSFTSAVQSYASGVQPSSIIEHPYVSVTYPCASEAQPTTSEQPFTGYAVPCTSGTQPFTHCVQPSLSAEKICDSGEQLFTCAQIYNSGAQPHISSAHLSARGKQPSTNIEHPSARDAQPCSSDAQVYTSIAKQLTRASQPSFIVAKQFTSGKQQHAHQKPSTNGVQIITSDVKPPASNTELSTHSAESTVKRSSPFDAQSASGTELVTSCILSSLNSTHFSLKVVEPHASHLLPSLRKEWTTQGKRHGDEMVKEGSETEGGDSSNILAWIKKRKRGRGTTHRLLEVPLNEVYQQCLEVLVTAGESLLASLQTQAVIGHNYKFCTLQSDHTRSLLNQIIRMRKDPYQPGSEQDMQYRKLLIVHGLVKATDLLCHYGLLPALHSLRLFHITHQVLIPDCYNEVLAKLMRLQEVEDVTHPKVKALLDQMSRARQTSDPNDAELKVLVVARRESHWVWRQLQQVLGTATVALLTSLPEYRRILHVLEHHSIVVWGGGEGLHQLPCSQFSLVVEWEGGGHASSVCVQHCARQNIHVVSFTITTTDEGARLKPLPEGNRNLSRSSSTDDGGGQRCDTLTLVAATSITNNAELHYILTSIYDLLLIERCLRDVEAGEGSEHGWADMLLDERTCIILQPLVDLRSDTNLNQLTCQLVLLSLQCTTCYIILFSQSPVNSGYVFRSGVVKALARLVATCALFCSCDYTVLLLLAHSLHQVGEMVRAVGEATRSLSTVWDTEEWTTRPWLTPQMSSHERLLLSLPCINSITAQMLHKLLHGDVTNGIPGTPTRLAKTVTSSPIRLEEVDGYKPLIKGNHNHSPQFQSHSFPEFSNKKESQRMYIKIQSSTDDRLNKETIQLYNQRIPNEELPPFYVYDDNSVFRTYSKDDFPTETCNNNVSDSKSRCTSLLIDPSFPAQKLSGHLFNAKEYLRSVTSTAGISYDQRQEISLLHKHEQQDMQDQTSQQQHEGHTIVSPYLPQLEKNFGISPADNHKPPALSQNYHLSWVNESAHPSGEDSLVHLPSYGLCENYSLLPPLVSDDIQYADVQKHGVYDDNMHLQQQHGYWNRSASIHRLTPPISSDEVQYDSVQSHDVFTSSSQQKQQHRCWTGSPPTHQKPLIIHPHSSKIFGVAKLSHQHGGVSTSVPPSPQVTLRQDGRGHDFPDHYDFPITQIRSVKSNHVAIQDKKKLVYQKVPGKGGQTKLVFQPV
ncbi:uncharacterized protein [Panulirus ornatus]|uniref:uncharacterized protein isoform X2 n=1 Tax=Panulirus ornatus TaxID=150431 RepID=UPI003A84F617